MNSLMDTDEIYPMKSDGNIRIDPNPAPVIEKWTEMEKAKDAGLVKHIGVSNFKVQLLNDLCAAAKIKPEVNQIEMHPYHQQNGMVDFCQKKGIHLTAWSPLMRIGSGGQFDPLNDIVMKKIADKYNKTVPQIMIRWGIQRSPNISAIPKSMSPVRIKENFQVFDFQLDQSDMAEIAKLDKHQTLSDISDVMNIPVFD
ncbi:MAG: putative aldehyde reductase [Streblomastix strix]|uniref:Putative aldehyde reductase n=1 Tax=Streblomastix strix TaxID=222440 RepID=A0A5J4UBT4_9EUKA|nr:MAG: putative aldehyde reductase [Streblomastix strix]